MKTIHLIIFVFALSLGSYAQNDTMFVHTKQGVFEIAVEGVDSMTFYRPNRVPVTHVTINYSSYSLEIGESQTFLETVFPPEATNKNVIWTSDNTAVATVKDGRVTAEEEAGTAIITVTSEDGSHKATCRITVLPSPYLDGCDNSTPGWGSLDLGAVNFKTSQTWIVGDQEWSDVVMAAACDKTNFNAGAGPFKADCRSNLNCYGNLFSWCAVVRFRKQLCPDGWRVPNVEDFIALDIALGGDGDIRFSGQADFILNNYLNPDVWGGAYGGMCYFNGLLEDQGSYAPFWTQDTFTNVLAVRMLFTEVGVYPMSAVEKDYGYTLRCVR